MKNKIEFRIDDTCELCQKALEKIAKLEKNHPNCYMNRNMKTNKTIRGISLVPDYNHAGNLTHWHIK